MFRSALPAALALALLTAPAVGQDASSLTLEVPLFATKVKNDVTTYKPLKLSKGGATVTVRFYDGQPTGAPPIHTSEVFIAAKVPGAPFSPGNQPQDDKVTGKAYVTLSDLPADLLTKNIYMTTQAVTDKAAYDESPARPLGLGGVTEGRDLNPRSITLADADGLMFASGASAGAVLTSDASGQASWQQIDTVGMADGSVTGAKIADRTITYLDLAENAVGQFELGPGAVTQTHMVDGAVISSKLATGSVDSAKVLDDSLTAADLASNSVGASEIAENAVGGSELGPNAVSSGHVADNSLTAADLAANSVGASEIAENAVGGSELGPNAVGSAHVADNSLTANDLAANSVGASELQVNSITGSLINNAADNWGFNGPQWGNADMRLGVNETDFGLVMEFANSLSNNNVILVRKGSPLDYEFAVSSEGNVTIDGSLSQGNGFAQMIEAGDDGQGEFEEGDVLVLDPHNPRTVIRSSGARSTLVAGLYAAEASLRGSHREWDEPILEDEADYRQVEPGEANDNIRQLDVRSVFERYREIPVGMSGIVKCKVSAENGAILPGDLLVTAWTPGHAMRDGAPTVGTVLGKALGELTSGTGVIDIIVTLD